MTSLKQIAAITAMNLRNLRARFWPSLVIVVGMVCVVGALISMLSMSAGLTKSATNTARPDRVMVRGKGMLFEQGSRVSRENVLTVIDAPGIKKGADGKPIASAEALAQIPVTKKANGFTAFIVIRGIGPKAFELRPEMKIVAGRMFQPAVREVIVGKAAQQQFKGLEIGDVLALAEGDWTVVGVFESGGNNHESELLVDSETLTSAYRRNGPNAVYALLESPTAYDTFAKAVTDVPGLNIEFERESDYYARQSEGLSSFLSIIAYWIGGIMAAGAMFGALNMMYAAVSNRTTEIATLRAIGFGAAGVVASVLAEAMTLAGLGAVIGATIAWLAFNGNTHLFGGLIFQLAVTTKLFIIGIVWALAIGLIGGLFPAIRAARLPVATALQQR